MKGLWSSSVGGSKSSRNKLSHTCSGILDVNRMAAHVSGVRAGMSSDGVTLRLCLAEIKSILKNMFTLLQPPAQNITYYKRVWDYKPK